MQRVVFLHEELIKIGSFPRKALEADLDLYKGGEMGKVSDPLNYSDYHHYCIFFIFTQTYFVFFGRNYSD